MEKFWNIERQTKNSTDGSWSANLGLRGILERLEKKISSKQQ